jgi:hypothetical protein
VKRSLLALVFIHGWISRRRVYFNPAEIDRAPTVPAQARLAASLPTSHTEMED